MKFWFPSGPGVSPVLFRSLLLLGFGCLRLQAQAPIPSPPGPLEVIANNGADQEQHLPSLNGVVPLLMIRPNQVVPVTLQFPTDKAGMAVAAMPMDGGEVLGGQLVILPTGKTVFTFKPGVAPGRYRVVVKTPVEEHLLEFYVVDPNNPPRRPARGQK